MWVLHFLVFVVMMIVAWIAEDRVEGWWKVPAFAVVIALIAAQYWLFLA